MGRELFPRGKKDTFPNVCQLKEFRIKCNQNQAGVGGWKSPPRMASRRTRFLSRVLGKGRVTYS